MATLGRKQFLLGYVSVQTTERHLGCKQRIQGAVNDHLGPCARQLSYSLSAYHRATSA
jgi:hypothetical protein